MAFFVVEAFFGADAFFAAVGAAALVLVTRPDLVLVSTLGTSTTAGAYDEVSIMRLLEDSKWTYCC